MIGSFGALLWLGTSVYGDYAVSWDEPYMRRMGLVTVRYLAEKFAPEWVPAESLQYDPLPEFTDRDYGVAFDAPAVMMEQLLGLEDSRDVYRARHLLTFLLCFGGLVAFYRLARRRFGVGVGLLATSFLVLSPRLLADSFYNSKDAVFAAAFVLATATLMQFASRQSAGTTAAHAAASALAIDVRIMAVVLVGATLAVLCAKILRREVAWRRGAAALVGYLALTAALVVAWWPWLWSNPVGNFVEAFAHMSQFRWPLEIRYLGRFVKASQLPWHYVPVWISITTPPWYLVLFAVGLLATLGRMATRGRELWRGDGELQDLVTLVLCVAPIAAVIALHSVLYDGWRHLYFVYPAFVLVAVRGWVALWEAGRPRHWLRGGVVALSLWSSVAVANWIRTAHPLENLYFNQVARWSLPEGVPLRAYFELDYWGLANQGALEWVLAHDPAPVLHVSSVGGHSLEQTVLMLKPEERARIDRTEAPTEPPLYVFTNYRLVRNLDVFDHDERFVPVHDVVVDGERVLRVYKDATPTAGPDAAGADRRDS